MNKFDIAKYCHILSIRFINICVLFLFQMRFWCFRFFLSHLRHFRLCLFKYEYDSSFFLHSSQHCNHIYCHFYLFNFDVVLHPHIHKNCLYLIALDRNLQFTNKQENNKYTFYSSTNLTIVEFESEKQKQSIFNVKKDIPFDCR